jgi:hypothetical protein
MAPASVVKLLTRLAAVITAAGSCYVTAVSGSCSVALVW